MSLREITFERGWLRSEIEAAELEIEQWPSCLQAETPAGRLREVSSSEGDAREEADGMSAETSSKRVEGNGTLSLR